MLIVTGLSGAGKSVALKTLEDLGYYCVDNLPAILLDNFVREFANHASYPIAVAIDARSTDNPTALAESIQQLKTIRPIETLFLNASDSILNQRYNESRRPHPKNHATPLPQSIAQERQLLTPLLNTADLIIDTSTYSAQYLKAQLQRVYSNQNLITLTLQSFGFKNGLPINADYLFDVRFLPNPHWHPELRPYSGSEAPIIEFLNQYPQTHEFIQDTTQFLQKWLPQFLKQNDRSYLTIAIGCTGGQHRSVYISEQLAQTLKPTFPQLQLEHRDRILYQPNLATQ